MAKGAFGKPSQKERKRIQKEAEELEEKKRQELRAESNFRVNAPAFFPGGTARRAPRKNTSPASPAVSNNNTDIAVADTPVEEPACQVQELLDDVSGLDEAGRQGLVTTVLRHMTTKETATARKRMVSELVRVVKQCGVVSLWRYGIVDHMVSSFLDQSNVITTEASCFLLKALVEEVGRGFEPSAVQMLTPLLEAAGHNKSVPLRTAAHEAATALTASLSPHAAPVVLSHYLAALESNSWRTKVEALSQLTTLTAIAPSQMSACLPTLLPVVSERLWDTRPDVKRGALELLTAASASIINDDVRPLTPHLVSAMARPDTETTSCLEKLLGTTFIAQVDPPTLALLVPLLSRGLREGGTAQTRKTARVIKNMCELVLDPEHVLPFVPLLRPGLERALEHCVIGEVVEVIQEALNALLKAMGQAGMIEGGAGGVYA